MLATQSFEKLRSLGTLVGLAPLISKLNYFGTSVHFIGSKVT